MLIYFCGMNNKEQVKKLLTDNPALRDNRQALIREVLMKKGLRFEEANFIAKQFPTMVKTDRNWRLIQQQNEELRGNSWQSRQKKSVEVAKEMVQDGV